MIKVEQRVPQCPALAAIQPGRAGLFLGSDEWLSDSAA
jgi:hypothetical protein